MSNVMDRPEDRTGRRPFINEAPPTADQYDHSTGFHRAGVFPAAALDSPMFEGKDLAGLIAGIVITLGPLAAYTLGWGA